MSCRIIATDGFKKDAKKLLKKYISLKAELAKLEADLALNPRMGTLIHNDTYKIRLAVKSKGKGKSGGMRIITHIVEMSVQIAEMQNTTIFLLTIYDKSDLENIADKDLQYLIQTVKTEIDDDEYIE